MCHSLLRLSNKVEPFRTWPEAFVLDKNTEDETLYMAGGYRGNSVADPYTHTVERYVDGTTTFECCPQSSHLQ